MLWTSTGRSAVTWNCPAFCRWLPRWMGASSRFRRRYDLEFQTGRYVVLEGEEWPAAWAGPDDAYRCLVRDRLGGTDEIQRADPLRGEGVILDGELQAFHDAAEYGGRSGDSLPENRINTAQQPLGLTIELLLLASVAQLLMPVASTGIHSCAVSPGPARPTRSGCFSSSSWLAPACG